VRDNIKGEVSLNKSHPYLHNVITYVLTRGKVRIRSCRLLP
jgi:hypothetical protein